MEQTLLKAAEIMNKVEDAELTDMIHKLDTIPAPKLELDINDHMNIYNWLKELELYRKLHGPLNKM